MRPIGYRTYDEITRSLRGQKTSVKRVSTILKNLKTNASNFRRFGFTGVEIEATKIQTEITILSYVLRNFTYINNSSMHNPFYLFFK